MKIKIFINISKKNKIPFFYFEGYSEYEKRLSRFCKIETAYFKNITNIESHLKEGNKVFIVNKKTTTISSTDFSEKLKDLSLKSNIYSNIIFIITDLDIDIDGEDFTISKAPMSYEMTHLILLEQIYRGYKILNNENYHK
ncbi:MAG: 23S rRNA (pseudouridine(1915)-N(3))-methyltransferase RlmH [Lachnospirales bacterium]